MNFTHLKDTENRQSEKWINKKRINLYIYNKIFSQPNR